MLTGTLLSLTIKQSDLAINELDPVASNEIISYFKTYGNIIYILNMRFIEIHFRVTTVLEIHRQYRQISQGKELLERVVRPFVDPLTVQSCFK